MRVASELRVIPTYVSLFTRHLLGQQVGFIEEQYYGYALEVDVVRDRVEYIERFFETIGFPEINQIDIDYFDYFGYINYLYCLFAKAFQLSTNPNDYFTGINYN